MALPDILETLRREADAEIADIVSMRDTEIANIESVHATFVRERTAHAQSDRERRTEKVAERILAKAHHQVVFLHTADTRARIESVFAEVQAQLGKLSDSAYMSFLDIQWKSISHADDMTFIVSVERQEQTTAFLKKHRVPASAITPQSGLLGGFIAITRDREYDCSFSKIVTLLKNEETVKLSKRMAS